MQSEFSRASIGAFAAAAVGLALAFGTVIIATFGVFMLEMGQEFGWGRAKVSGLLLVATACQAPLSLLVGRLIDRWGVRRVVLRGIVLYGASVMALSLADGSMAALYLLFALVGTCSALVTMLPYSKVIAGWFDRSRGLMLSLYAVLAATLGSLAPQVARHLIEAFGWRGGYLGLGALVILVGFPVLFFLLRESPTPVGRAEAAPATGPTAAEVRRNPLYWQIIAAITLCAFAIGGVHAHLVPILIGRGLSKGDATNVLSLYALASTAAQVSMGALLDRIRRPAIAAPVFGLAIVGLAILQHGGSTAAALAGGALLGASVGAEMSLAKYLHARYFGVAAFGQIFSVQFLFISLTAGLGPVALGLVFDKANGYGPGLVGAIVLLAASVLLIARLPPYPSAEPGPQRRPSGNPQDLVGRATAAPLAN